jgi:hypothetical protein
VPPTAPLTVTPTGSSVPGGGPNTANSSTQGSPLTTGSADDSSVTGTAGSGSKKRGRPSKRTREDGVEVGDSVLEVSAAVS